MTTTQDLRSPTSSPLVEDLDASGILTSIRSRKAAEDQAAADVLALAAAWADLHPPESLHGAASFTTTGGLGHEHEEPIAGPGCPLVAEFCIAELGTVLGITTTSAKKLIGHALELRHRLPRLWSQVHAGAVPAWRARATPTSTRPPSVSPLSSDPPIGSRTANASRSSSSSRAGAPTHAPRSRSSPSSTSPST
ncbi:hypothetical protein [Nocardioides alpinus]|uniref:hypothetical protein n=1 Tax=Nocardioides alpinus TaxID=748909 RepID=UPI0012FF40FC|nr:hypothetical protein [Nocardioides alpinus]